MGVVQTRGVRLGFVIVALVLTGCRAIHSPIAIVVADKEARTRLERQFRGLTTGPTGYVHEVHQYVEVPEFWVRSTEGRWYRVDERTWRTAEIGQRLTIAPWSDP